MTSRNSPRAAYALAVVALVGSSAAGAQPAEAPKHIEHGPLVYEGIPPTEPALAATLQRYLHSRGATFLDWTADGGVLVKTRFAETEQLHRVAFAGAEREQLTFYPDPIEWARAAKSGSGVIYWKDNAGDDNFQIYSLGANGQIRQLTSGDFIHGSPVWAHDGRRVAFYGNDRDSLELRHLRGRCQRQRAAAAAHRRQG